MSAAKEKLYVMKPNATNLKTILYNGKCAYSEDTIETYKNDNSFVILSPDAAMILMNENEGKRYLHNIYLSNEEDYWDMLEVLPPLRMFSQGTAEGFLMSELTTGDITSCYVCFKGIYYSLNVRISDKIEAIISRLDDAILNNKIIKG